MLRVDLGRNYRVEFKQGVQVIFHSLDITQLKASDLELFKNPSSISYGDDKSIDRESSAMILYHPNEDLRPEIKRERAMSFVKNIREGTYQGHKKFVIHDPAR